MYSSVRRTLRTSSQVWLTANRHFFAVPLNDPKSFCGHKSYQTPARLDHGHIFRQVLNEWMSFFKIFTSAKGTKFIRYNIWLPVILSWQHQLVWPMRLREHLKKHIAETLEKVWWDPRKRAQNESDSVTQDRGGGEIYSMWKFGWTSCLTTHRLTIILLLLFGSSSCSRTKIRKGRVGYELQNTDMDSFWFFLV